MKKLTFSLILLLFLTGSLFADSAVEDAVNKAAANMRSNLKSGVVSLPENATATIVAIKRGEKRDETAERKTSVELWKIAKDFKFTMLDREYVEERLRELRKTVTDLFNPEKAPKIDGSLVASYLFVGEVVKKGKVEEMSLKMIETETGDEKWRVLVEGYPHKHPIVSALLSLFMPGAGQLLNESKGKSVLFLGTASGLAVGGVIYHSRYSDSHDRYLKATNIDDINSFYEESRKPYKLRALFLGLYSLCALASSTEAYNEAAWCEKQRQRIEVTVSPDRGITVAFKGTFPPLTPLLGMFHKPLSLPRLENLTLLSGDLSKK
jgi:hypothetical protein